MSQGKFQTERDRNHMGEKHRIRRERECARRRRRTEKPSMNERENASYMGDSESG